jgi:hypothetical protein
MRVLRKGGEFLDHNIRRSGKKAIWYLLGFGAVCGLLFFVSYQLVALLGLVLAFRHFTAAYDKWESWFLGKRGELAVTRALSALPDDYVLLNDLMLPNGRGNIDHFLIGPKGLFVIETKNYSADVQCDGDRWFLNGKLTKSLSSQAKGSAMTLRRHLQGLFAEHRARLPFIEPILVFVKHRHRLELNQPTVSVLRLEELVAFISSYEPQSRTTRFSSELIRATVHHLQSLQNSTVKIPGSAATTLPKATSAQS